MNTIKRPMKAPSKSISNEELSGLKYPVVGSPKLDGFRCVIDHIPLTSSMKPFTNKFIAEELSNPLFHGLDWEEQLKAVPTLSDGHSGNTFGCACMLARLQLECPERVYELHGSLSPLVGSKDFGDIPVGE
jgi:hypothetical protein